MMSNTSTTVVEQGRLSDEGLLQKARMAANGHRFAIRFDQRSDSPAQQGAYETRGDAALALLVNLAWWSRGDRKQMSRLFKRSALGGEFEETGDLGQPLDRLIEKAIELVGDEGYNPQFYKTDENGGQ